MTDEGVYSVHRGIFEHPLFKNQPERFYAWNWMLAHAVWKETKVQIKGRVIPLERGQLSYSERFLAEKWKWSKSRVNRLLTLFERENMIVRKSDHGQNQITLCNYSEYQLGRTTDRTESGPAADQQRTKEEALNHLTIETGKRDRASRAARLPDDWSLCDKDRSYACDAGFSDSEIARIAVAFGDYHRARGTRMVDWSAAWRTWVRNEIKFSKDRRNGPERSRLLDAADDLTGAIERRIQGWGTPGALEIGGGEDAAAVRLLPKG